MTTEQFFSDFFTAGGTLPPDAPSYVKRPSDDELFRHIIAGEFCYVLTPRQMGKSSLMIRTVQRLSREGTKSAIVDLTQIGTVDDEDQWYKGILTQIRRRLRLSVDPVAWWEDRKDIPRIQKFIEFFEEMLFEVKERIVIFIDEIDTTLKLDFRDDFFAGIRAMFNARAENPDLMRITFVLLGVASPSDLIKDRSRTPFNIGQEIPLRSFSREDARMLEKGLEEVYPNHGKEILDRVFYWTNGHPYLTQKLCQSIVESRFKRYDDKDIDSLVKKLFTSEEASRETNLQFVRDNVLSYPERRVILSLYKKLLRGSQVPDNKNSLPQNHLKLSGLARVEGGKLVVGNKIYGTVFNQRWVRRYTDVDWRYPIIGFLSLVILGFSFIFYNDGVRLPNQAATRVNGIPIYRDDRGIQYLADLFRMKPYIFPNEYEYKAKDVFFNSFSNWEEQKALIEIGYGEPHPPPEDYEVVVTGLYTSLADIDGSGDTARLLEIMYKSLEEMKMQEEGVYQEIGYWLEATKSANNKNYTDARDKYTAAITLNPKNPATLFERARIYTLLGNFEDALKDYEQVIAIVPESNIEPTEVYAPVSSTETAKVITTAFLTTSPFTLTSIPTRTRRSTSSTIVPRETIITTFPEPVTSPPPLQLAPTPTFTVTPTPTLPVPLPIQSKFLTRGQRISAVSNDLNQNKSLTSFLLQAKPGDYPELAAILPILATALTSTNLTPTGASPFSGTATITLVTEPDTFNPLYAYMWYSNITRDLWLKGLWSFNENNQPIPEIAAEIPTTSNGGLSADGRTITIKLRENVKWSDGEPLTAEDFIFSYDMIMSDKNSVTSRHPYEEYIESVEAPDPYTLVLHLKEPFAPWLTGFFQNWVLPRHVLQPAFEADGTLDNAAWNNTPTVGVGPFIFSEWERGSHIIFKRNADWIHPPKLEQISIRFVPDDASQEAAIIAGDTDIGVFLSSSQIENLEAGNNVNIVAVSSGYDESWFLNVNPATAHPAMLDVRVRKAIALATDRFTIVRDLLNENYFSVNTTFWDSTPPYGNPSLQPYPYDPDQARQLLDAAGWRDSDGDGIRDKIIDGKKTDLKLRYITTTREIRKNVQALVQKQWALVGIGAELTNYDASVFWNYFSDGGPQAQGLYDIAEWSGSGTPYPDPEASTYWFCNEISSADNPIGNNYQGVCMGELDALLNEQAVTLDTQRRIDIYHQIAQIMYDEVLYIGMWTDPDLWSVNKRLQNVRLSGGSPFWNVHEWEAIP